MVSIPFKRESTLKVERRRIRKTEFREVSIPFKRESTLKVYMATHPLGGWEGFNSLQTGKHTERALILSPVGPWLRKPKTMRELHTAFFDAKFTPKIPKTRMYTETDATFYEKRL